MEFSADVTGLAAKDTSNGNRIELKLSAQFDTALFAQLGECFSARVHVAINHPQGALEFGEGGVETGPGEDGADPFGELYGEVEKDETRGMVDEVEEAETDEELLHQKIVDGYDEDEDLNRKELREEIEKGQKEVSEDPAGEPGGEST